MGNLDKKAMIVIPKFIINQIIDQAKQEFPNEACGLLAGQGNRVTNIYKMANTDKSSDSFLMDPKEQFAVMKKIRQEKVTMLAIYHSHPFTPARPSAKDIEMALYPETLYLIISLEKQDEPVIKAFEIKNGLAAQQEIKIEEG